MTWERCLEHLNEVIPKRDFKTYFTNLQVIEDEHRLTVFAMNDFVRVMLGNYSAEIASAVRQNIGELDVNIVIGSKNSYRKKTYNKISEFVLGDCNRLANACVCQVLRKSGIYNPLLVWGGEGTGKTHLLKSIFVNKQLAGKVKKLIGAEQWVKEVVEATTTGVIYKLRDAYCVDYLFIDNVHQLVGKKRSQAELARMMKAMMNQRKQVILTANQFPLEGLLSNELWTIIDNGVVAELETPDEKTAHAIMAQQLKRKDLHATPEIIQFIYTNFGSNAHLYESNIDKLAGLADAVNDNNKLDNEVLESALKTRMIRKNITVQSIQKLVAQFYGIAMADLLAKGRGRECSDARHMAMKLIRDNTKKTYAEIGQAFGGRDHSSVMSAYKKVTGLISQSHNIKQDYDTLNGKIKSKV